MRTTSALVGKAYSAAGQAAACLHTMSLLQAYQAELLTDLDEGELTPSCPSPFDVLRGPVCQPCHLVCFRTQRSISGFTRKRSGLGVCAPSEEASERSVQTQPAGSPLQDIVLSAHIRIHIVCAVWTWRYCSSLSVGHSRRHVGGPTNWDIA